MTRELKALLDSLHSVFNKDPIPRPAIRIRLDIDDAIPMLEIEDHFLTISIEEQGLSASPFDAIMRPRGTTFSSTFASHVAYRRGLPPPTYNLRLWTLERLIEDLNTYDGITAELINYEYRRFLSTTLIENVAVDITTPYELKIATSPLWTILKPIAFMLEDAGDDIDTALAQLNVLTSQKYFADYWGLFLGVTRKAGESDLLYTQRIIDTILMHRTNNLALEEIVKKELGIDIVVRDLLPEVLILNRSIIFSRLAGEVYNAGNFMITGASDAALLDLINKHKAAGTRVFFATMIDATLDLSTAISITMTSDFFDVSVFDSTLEWRIFRMSSGISDEIEYGDTGLPYWTVGITPLPGSLIA